MPGDESGTGGGPGDAAAERADHLLERGLELYRSGDLLGALAEWEALLAVDPDHERARQYVDYVRANFDALEAQFEAARAAERTAEAEGVPVPEARGDAEAAYDSLDIELSDASETGDFADGLAELLSDRPRLTRLAAQARDYASEWSGPERARQLADLYRTLVAR